MTTSYDKFKELSKKLPEMSEQLEKITKILLDEKWPTVAIKVVGGTWVWYSDDYKGQPYDPRKDEEES